MQKSILLKATVAKNAYFWNMKIRVMTRRLFAFGLCGLIYFTTVGFAIDFHYCNGQLKSISLLGKARSCHEASKSCPNHNKQKEETPTLKKDNFDCCSNEFHYLQCEQDVQFEVSNHSELEFQTDREQNISCLVPLPKEKQIALKSHPPPEFDYPSLRRDNLPLWHQSFLC